MKKLSLLFVILLFAGCAAVGTQTGEIDAEFQIIKWAPLLGTSVITGTYKLKNTGNVPIGYYKVYFKTTCKDGSRYDSEGWGPARINKLSSPIAVGEEWSGPIMFKVGCKEVVSVKISDWKIRRHY